MAEIEVDAWQKSKRGLGREGGAVTSGRAAKDDESSSTQVWRGQETRRGGRRESRGCDRTRERNGPQIIRGQKGAEDVGAPQSPQLKGERLELRTRNLKCKNTSTMFLRSALCRQPPQRATDLRSRRVAFVSAARAEVEATHEAVTPEEARCDSGSVTRERVWARHVV